jgi:DNA adenine methylase
MADWIITHMPQHTTYLEPYFGSGAVFFSKPPAQLETINDIDGDVVNLFRVIRDRPDELARLVYWTPYSRQEYYNSYQSGGVGRSGESAEVPGAVLDGPGREDIGPDGMAA